jgi:hypothetical protein
MGIAEKALQSCKVNTDIRMKKQQKRPLITRDTSKKTDPH